MSALIMRERIKVRRLSQDDIEDIIRIEKALGGQVSSDLHLSILEYFSSSASPINLGAELDGKLIGFIIGELKSWEFGENKPVGWVKELGVDPAYQGQGVGVALGRELMRYFSSNGVTIVKTLVEWDSGDVISYFRGLGFKKGSQIVLKADLSTLQFE
ncbi:MAG: GNAT family N-acetyltransferase [Candidatus Hodarchaeales archaeon]